MPIINALLAELDQESKSTTRMLERVPSEHLAWAPHAKSSSLGKLAWHLATIPSTVGKMLNAGSFDLTQARPGAIPEDAASIVDEYRRNFAATRELLTTLSDDVLHEPFVMMRGEQTVMKIPKVAVVRMVLMNHSYHHRGQLSVYLRLLDVPVPALYGTTADEAM